MKKFRLADYLFKPQAPRPVPPSQGSGKPRTANPVGTQNSAQPQDPAWAQDLARAQDPAWAQDPAQPQDRAGAQDSAQPQDRAWAQDSAQAQGLANQASAAKPGSNQDPGPSGRGQSAQKRARAAKEDAALLAHQRVVQRRRSILVNLSFLLLIAFFLAAFVFLCYKYPQQKEELLRLQKEQARLKKELSEVQQKQEDTKNLLSVIDSRDFIEQVAREELGLVKANEILFLD